MGKKNQLEFRHSINDYFLLIERNGYDKNSIDSLLFWKTHLKSPTFANLAKLAKKVLGVLATSVEVERKFSIDGHILPKCDHQC